MYAPDLYSPSLYQYRVIDLLTSEIVARFDNLPEALAFALDHDPESDRLVVR